MSASSPSVRSGKIFCNGWTVAAGGVQVVRKLATGQSLEKTGIANAADVSRAAASAGVARTAWAVNCQTVHIEFHVPFGGMGVSGNGGRLGGPAKLDAFTQTQLVSVMEQPIVHPF